MKYLVRMTVVGIVTMLCATAVADAKPIRRLTEPAAKFYIGKALKREAEFSWEYANGKKITSCKRLSRVRVRCEVSWFIGDTSFDGHSAIWLDRKPKGLFWFYSYDIRGVNGYCQDVGGLNCVRHWHVD